MLLDPPLEPLVLLPPLLLLLSPLLLVHQSQRVLQLILGLVALGLHLLHPLQALLRLLDDFVAGTRVGFGGLIPSGR